MISKKEITARRHIEKSIQKAMKKFKEALKEDDINVSIDEVEYKYKSINGKVSMSGKFAYTLKSGENNE